MIAKSYIQKNLKQLEARFSKAKTPKDNLYFSKLAVMELCGWVEVSLDDVVERIIQQKLKETKNKRDFSRDVIKRNWGFKYENFRRMLTQAVGIIVVERIEKKVDQNVSAQFQSGLGNLTTARNSIAHTYIPGMQATIDAPSVTMARFNHLYDGLKEFERVIFKLI